MFKVSIKGVLVAPDGRVVLLQNERNEWELPGGQIELGETPAQCLAREIQEELRLEVEVGRPLDTYLFEVTPGRHVFIVTYECALIGPFGPTVSHEHKGIGLFSEDCLPEDLPAGTKPQLLLQCEVPTPHSSRQGYPLRVTLSARPRCRCFPVDATTDRTTTPNSGARPATRDN